MYISGWILDAAERPTVNAATTVTSTQAIAIRREGDLTGGLRNHDRRWGRLEYPRTRPHGRSRRWRQAELGAEHGPQRCESPQANRAERRVWPIDVRAYAASSDAEAKTSCRASAWRQSLTRR